MPHQSEKLKRLAEGAGQYELPYISKSRVVQWVKNPEHFRFKYLEDIREPETDAMVRGSRIHETFEHYYESAREHGQHLPPEHSDVLPEDRQKWAAFIEPYLSNFFVWEAERWLLAGEVPEYYLPVGIEEEVWCDQLLGIEGEPEWMGIADAVLPVQSIDGIDNDRGDVVIVDFKTGKVPDKKYRDDGIYLELEYYQMVFETKYDVAGAAAFYPKTGTLLRKPDDPELQQEVIAAARDMVESCNEYDGTQQFEAKEGPLCKWGTDPDQESGFYGICSQCSWGTPAKNPETFTHYVEEGWKNWEIAQAMGCSENAVSYWRYKMDL